MKKTYREGSDKGVPYQGVLIIANGDTLAERLYDDELVNEPPGKFQPILSKRNFFNYLDHQVAEDGAYVYDCTHDRIAHVSDINNTPPGLPRNFPLYDRIPADFVSMNGKIPVSPETIGTKTRLAIKVPAGYARFEAQAFQIKRSRYGPLSVGKVTHFNKDGLKREFLLDYQPHSPGPFINEDQGIVGLLRTYEKDPTRSSYCQETIVDPKIFRQY